MHSISISHPFPHLYLIHWLTDSLTYSLALPSSCHCSWGLTADFAFYDRFLLTPQHWSGQKILNYEVRCNTFWPAIFSANINFCHLGKTLAFGRGTGINIVKLILYGGIVLKDNLYVLRKMHLTMAGIKRIMKKVWQ